MGADYSGLKAGFATLAGKLEKRRTEKKSAAALIEKRQQDLDTTIAAIFAVMYIFVAFLVGITTGQWAIGFGFISPIALAGMWVGGIPAAAVMLVASIIVMFVLKATWLRGI